MNELKLQDVPSVRTLPEGYPAPTLAGEFAQLRNMYNLHKNLINN